MSTLLPCQQGLTSFMPLLSRIRQSSRSRRVLVLGLDCASPDIVFSPFQSELPNLSALIRTGTWGILESSTPCITVPAWSSMLSSRDPGVLGVYGFRNRDAYDYSGFSIADSYAIQEPRVWDIIGQAGQQSLIMSVPQTYPARPLNGNLISGFMAKGPRSAFTYPAIFKAEVLKHTPHYQFDVRDFRTNDKGGLLQRILDFTEVQYQAAQHALTRKDWQFAMHVNMGVDRIHHGFWHLHDPLHRQHEPGSPFADAIRDYYRMVDEHIGQILARIDDDVAVMVVSDHGVRRMDGAICINEWLWQHGWLTLRTPPPPGKITPFKDIDVDWANTRAWSTGGYYGRIFLNVQGRETQGTIPPDQYEQVRDELAAEIRAIPDDQGQPLNNQVFRPRDIYQQVNGIAPDLIVYFGDLYWRTVGSMGYGKHTSLNNDTGPDAANHAPDGLFILNEPVRQGQGQISRRQLMDVAPTILNRMGIAVPSTMQGRMIE